MLSILNAFFVYLNILNDIEKNNKSIKLIIKYEIIIKIKINNNLKI